MGSKLSRQRSLDFESKLSRRRRPRKESPAESESGGSEFLFTSLMLRSEKLPGMLRRSNHSPYVRRVAWIREIQRLLREHKTEQAGEVLKLLRKVSLAPGYFHSFQFNLISDPSDWSFIPIHGWKNPVFSRIRGKKSQVFNYTVDNFIHSVENSVDIVSLVSVLFRGLGIFLRKSLHLQEFSLKNHLSFHSCVIFHNVFIWWHKQQHVAYRNGTFMLYV